MERLRIGSLNSLVSVLAFAAALLVGTVVVVLAVGAVFQRERPEPVDGRIDLRAWDGIDPVPLGGSWSFDPERLVGASEFGRTGDLLIRQVPDIRFTYPGKGFSATGSGTYRLQLAMPPGVHDLALRYSTVWTAFEIETNGVVVARVGMGSGAPSVSGSGIVRIPASDQVDLIVRVLNQGYRWGGIIQPFLLGPYVGLTTQKGWDDTCVFLVIGALLGLAANALFLFAFRRRDGVYPWFAAFAFSAIFRSLTAGDALLTVLFPSMGFDQFVRIQYASLYLMMPAGAMFFYHLFIEDIRRREIAWFVVPHIVLLLLVPWVPLSVLSWSLIPYVPAAVILLCYGYYLACIRPTLRNRPGAIIDLVAGTVLFAAILANMNHEILEARAETAFPWAMASFVILQSLVMAKRFTWAFNQTETLSRELKDSYHSLMKEARAAEEARDQLQALVAEKDLLLREVHHRVKNSLQVITSIINLQVRRAKDPGVVSAYGAVRDRIRSLTSVYERLYGLESETRIDLPRYLVDLVEQFGLNYPEEGAQFHLETVPVEVSLDVCSDVGLILTELVLNAYRHAVIPAGGGPIRIRLESHGPAIVLVVADDGPGFAPGFDPEQVTSVGLKIVTSLVARRKGTVTVNQGPGAVVTVRMLI